MWILLDEGMKLERGDEYYDSCDNKWVDMYENCGPHVFGTEFDEELDLPVRRKINTGNPKLPTIEECISGCGFSDSGDSHNQACIGGARAMYEFMCRQLQAGA